MEELKLYVDVVNEHLESLKNTFEDFKQKLKSSINLSEKEKEIQLIKAKTAFLKEKKQLKDKLF